MRVAPRPRAARRRCSSRSRCRRRRAARPRPPRGRRRRAGRRAPPSSRVVDGDTIVVRHRRPADERVRLIGIDTPETVKPEHAGAVLRPRGVGTHHRRCCPPGTTVRLERDVEARDRYGRLLAYVYRASDGLFVNLALARDGFAALLDHPAQHRPRRRVRGRGRRRPRAPGAGLWGRVRRAAVADAVSGTRASP